MNYRICFSTMISAHTFSQAPPDVKVERTAITRIVIFAFSKGKHSWDDGKQDPEYLFTTTWPMKKYFFVENFVSVNISLFVTHPKSNSRNFLLHKYNITYNPNIGNLTIVRKDEEFQFSNIRDAMFSAKNFFLQIYCCIVY